jgi:translation initiation factor RLI1
VELDLSTYKKPIIELLERLKRGDGQTAAMLGDNGIGKSTVVNLLLLNSSVDLRAYAARTASYVLEALQSIAPSAQVDDIPTLDALLDGTATIKKDSFLEKVHVEVLELPAAEEQQVRPTRKCDA